MQSILMTAFSILSIVIMLITGVLLYIKFSDVSKQKEVHNTQEMIEQTKEAMEDYLVTMRQISDTVYYNVVKENDFSAQEQGLHAGMNLLYEANKDSLRSIAIYNNYGSLMAAEPVASQKEDPDITSQSWYQQAEGGMENIHFSAPHIQNLFDDGTMRYYWVISLSRAVELTEGGDSQLGVLLVDMDYFKISRMMEQLNAQNDEKYYYLCGSDGKIIYHPKQIQIGSGLADENSREDALHEDGVYSESFEGEHRKVIVDTIGYTGWKLVGVIPPAAFKQDMFHTGLFIALYIVLMAMVLMAVNRIISLKISKPLSKLNESVKDYEAGKKPEIYLGGSAEIEHLGQSIQHSYEQIDLLMKKNILEQNERRKSELDALQSQINPHFLYNALESITWMIEGEQNDKAVFMVTQLAKLFRISLSKGRTIIPVKDELQHAQSYMNIQKVRYKNAVSVTFDMAPEITSCCIVKLVLQPILENSIKYAIHDMEEGGVIKVSGSLKDGTIVISVADNGIGMSEEEVSAILTEKSQDKKHGSGVGLVNVNRRLQLFFGKRYGVKVESRLDEGTAVFITIPAVPYSEETRKTLEQGYGFGGEEMLEGKNRAETDENKK